MDAWIKLNRGVVADHISNKVESPIFKMFDPGCEIFNFFKFSKVLTPAVKFSPFPHEKHKLVQ